MVEAMKIQNGYKQTEVGIISSDWDVMKLEKLVEKFVNGGTPSTHIAEYWNGSIPWITGADILNQKVSLIRRYISKEAVKNSSTNVIEKGNLLLVSRTGVGKLAIAPIDIAISQDFTGIYVKKSECSTEYLFRYFDFVQTELKSQNQGTSIQGITRDTLSSFQIPIPPTKAEQTAIATALNDADALITQLEKLIAKKRNIKLGTMQELLRPKEGWDWTTVEKLGNPYGGLSGKSKSDFSDGNYPYIPFMNIMSNPIIDKGYLDYVKISPTENQNRAQKDDLFFNGSSETPEEVGMCSVLLDDIPNLYLNSFCFGFRLNKELNNDGLYLSYYFRSNYGRRIFYTLAQGATRHNLSKSNFIKIEFQIPDPKEQTHIAQILSDMDAEIEALEKKLWKYKMIKQGMMQNLLTGRIRLIENVEVKGKVIPIDKNSSQKNRNWHINEAVVIAVLAKEFATDGYLLSRKRYTKLSYLLHRQVDRKTEGYLKKAAGPYNPATRYKGPETIAIKNKYIKESTKGQYSGFTAAEDIARAEKYFNQWYGRDVLQWLEQFKFEKNDTLELWTTVDMAVQELKREGEEVSKEAVKSLIKNTKEWKPKLKRPVFSDGNIAGAILKTEKLFK